MLGLLFCEKASKGDNIGIDFLLGYRRHFAVVLCHFWFCWYCVVVDDGFFEFDSVERKAVSHMQGEVVITMVMAMAGAHKSRRIHGSRIED